MPDRGRPRTRARTALVSALTAAALALAACGGGSAANHAASSGSVPAGLQRFYDQKLGWQPCPWQAALADRTATSRARAKKVVAGFQCTQLTVPLDYSRPGGPTIKLTMDRLATGKAHRIGALLTNPGGPGESGVSFAFGAKSYFTPALRARYDIVGLDPRGVGLSSPVLCKITNQQASAPGNPVAGAAQFDRACEKTSGKILPYVGTSNAARDLDIARAALGESRLDYYGGSYGTLLGQVYAQMFPHHVGHMVLDSVESPATPGDPTAQVMSLETTLQVMAQTCVAQGNCPMGSSRSEVLARFDKLLGALGGLRSGQAVADEVLALVFHATYSEQQWPIIYAVLGAVFHGNPRPLARLIKQAQGGASVAASAGGTEVVPGSFQAIDCLSMPQDQRTVAAARQATREAQAASPHFWWAVASTWFKCAKWPVPSPPGAGRAIRAPGTPTILLVNNTYDPATPVSLARTVQAELANSVLVTNEAGGHGFYKTGGACVHKVVDDFLISGTKPAAGTTCHDRPALRPPTSGHRIAP